MRPIGIRLILVFASFTVASLPAAAQAPLEPFISYQGFLTDNGDVIPGPTNYSMTFRLYDAAAGGTALTTVGPVNVPVEQSLFTVDLNVPVNTWNGDDRWLEIQVGAQILSPRQKIRPAPYAVYALSAGGVAGECLPWNCVGNSINNSNSGNVGVGTASPARRLHVSNGSSGATSNGGVDLVVEDDSSTYLNLLTPANLDSGVLFGIPGNSADGAVLYNAAGDRSMYFRTGGNVNRMMIADTGEVGIGTSIPDAQLTIDGTNSSASGLGIIAPGSTTGRIDLTGPTGVPGIVSNANNGHRRDIRFGDSFMQFLVSASASAPSTSSGITILNTGDVGIGTGSPGAVLHLRRDQAAQTQLRIENPSQDTLAESTLLFITGTAPPGSARLSHNEDRFEISNLSRPITLKSDGVEISSGFGGGQVWMLAADGTSQTVLLTADEGDGGSSLRLRNAAGNNAVVIDADDTGGGAAMTLRKADGSIAILFDAVDANGDGRVRTQVLEITGGGDLSEQFHVTCATVEPQPGMVVVIDESTPGGLCVATQPYDRKVAGVISGAGGVKPGMLMGQKGSIADGEHPVALTGRVYVWVDADIAPVRIGDQLTTSNTAGHAMKATDYAAAQGAVIGKAMTSLDSGRGLVLVLVSLQ